MTQMDINQSQGYRTKSPLIYQVLMNCGTWLLHKMFCSLSNPFPSTYDFWLLFFINLERLVYFWKNNLFIIWAPFRETHTINWLNFYNTKLLVILHHILHQFQCPHPPERKVNVINDEYIQNNNEINQICPVFSCS
jgi:hypothetical protein